MAKGESPLRVRSFVRRHGVAYASAHEVTLKTGRPKINDWPGLLATVRVARKDLPSDLLIAYWQSHEDSERNAKAFAAAVGPCTFEGFLREAREHWWTRVNRYVAYNTILLTLVAILGAVQALRSYGDWIFLLPSLDLYTDSPKLRYVAGNPIEQTIHVVNRTSTAHHDVKIVSATLKEAGGHGTVALTPSWLTPIPLLAVNTPDEFEVEGIAPKPGTYTLVVDVTSEAGWARGHRPQTFIRPVEVWDREPQATRLHPGDRKNEFVGQVLVGRALNGIDCIAEVGRQPGITSLVPSSPTKVSTREKAPNTTPGAEYAGVEWRMEKSDALQRVPFSIFVIGTVDRNFNSNSIEVHCYATPESAPAESDTGRLY